MSDLAAIRTALAANLASITDLQVSPYALAQPTPPGIQILPGEIQYDLAMRRGYDVWRFMVQAFVDFSADIGSQVLLDQLLAPSGARSVKTALESDQTLGGAAFAVHVTSAGGYRLVDRAQGGQLVLVEFTVEVHVSN